MLASRAQTNACHHGIRQVRERPWESNPRPTHYEGAAKALPALHRHSSRSPRPWGSSAPGRTRFVSNRLSHDVAAGSTHAVGVDVDLDELDRAVRGELDDERAGDMLPL